MTHMANWKRVVPDPRGLCQACAGSGSDWPRRKDGQYDRRYTQPCGPCPECGGRVGFRTIEEWDAMGVKS